MKVQNLGILRNAASQDETCMQYKGFWKYNTYDFTSRYMHMKTNINSAPNMWMIEAVGYNYAMQLAIRSAWTFHWDGNGLYSVSYRNLGGNNSLNPTNVYRSLDGYIVIAAYSDNWGYSGFMLNAYNTADVYYQYFGINRIPEIIAFAYSASNNPVY